MVYDPFVGTGSLLVAAAHLGAVTLGADIDVRVVRDGKQVHVLSCAHLARARCCLCSKIVDRGRSASC